MPDIPLGRLVDLLLNPHKLPPKQLLRPSRTHLRQYLKRRSLRHKSTLLEPPRPESLSILSVPHAYAKSKLVWLTISAARIGTLLLGTQVESRAPQCTCEQSLTSTVPKIRLLIADPNVSCLAAQPCSFCGMSAGRWALFLSPKVDIRT